MAGKLRSIPNIERAEQRAAISRLLAFTDIKTGNPERLLLGASPGWLRPAPIGQWRRRGFAGPQPPRPVFQGPRSAQHCVSSRVAI